MEKLERAKGSVENLAGSRVAATRGATLALNRVLPEDKRISGIELDQMLERVHAESLPDAVRDGRAAGLHEYSGLTDAELKQYAGFVETDEARWFYEDFTEAFHEAVESMADRLVSELASLQPAVP